MMVRPVSLCLLAATFGSVLGSGQVFAQPASPGQAAEIARLSAEVARLDRELREQKQLFMQMMQSDQQRYDMILQLIRSQATGAPPTGLPPAPAMPGARPDGIPVPGVPGVPAPAVAPPAVATVNGQVALPSGVDEAYVYFEGRLPTRARAFEIKQENKQFSPQVSVVPVGSKVSFPNADVVFHNVFSRSPAMAFDLGTVKSGERTKPVTLSQPGHIEIHCNIHSRMRADVLVVPNGHFTKVRPDGTFSLPGVPVGSRKLVLWGPSLKSSSQVVEVRSGAQVSLTATAAPAGQHKNKYGESYKSYEP